MELESIRLRTFVTYARDAPLSAVGLARAGFTYKGIRREIECFNCRWRTVCFNISFEDIVKDHAMMYPTCQSAKEQLITNAIWNTDTETSFLEVLKRSELKPNINKTNCSENAKHACSRIRKQQTNHFNKMQIFFAKKSIGNISTMNQRNRTHVRSTPLEESIVPSVNEATSTGREDIQSESSHLYDTTEEYHPSPIISTTERVSTNQQAESTNHTNITPSSPTEVPDPHASSSISTNHAQDPRANNGSGEVGPGPTYSDLGIVTEMPKRPEYALKSKRKETFLSWPRDHHLRPEELSEAGFYYAGYGDCARCFYCGGGLRNWEDEDDVWVEHARWFPKCAYIRGKIGINFVEIVQDLSKQLEQISLKAVTDILGHPLRLDTPDSNIRNDPAVRSVIELGYNETDVVEVVGLLKEQSIPLAADVILDKLKKEMKHKSNTVTTNQLQTITNPQLNRVSLNELKERNNQLRQQNVCKICLDKDVSVVFLPCGHLVSCTECYIVMRDCPVCRTKIKGTVRAFIS